MLQLIKNLISKQEGKNKYNKLLKEFLADGKLDDEEKKELEDLMKEYGLKKEDLINAHKKASSLAFKNIIEDKKITEEEKEALEDLMDYFDVEKEDFKFNQNDFNKFYTLGLIDKGILPTIDQHDLDIIFKKGEILHWGCVAHLLKRKRKTNRVSYGGPTASIKIMKGVRYRVGSVGYSTSSTEYLDTDDIGAFWLTNQRMGFKGGKKSFTFPYNKLHAFEATKEGLVIFKEGRENPFLIKIDDYDIPCMIISKILNEEVN
jgi:polyhydroxyalkanoate synthesis regulator phasin